MSQAQTQTQPSYAPSSGPAPPPAKHRRSPYERRASPPPIATLPTHSGSPSPSASPGLDRSAVSTPPIAGQGAPRRDAPPPPPPPHHHPGYAYDMPRGYGAGGYMYAPPPPPQYHHDERYAQHPHPHDPHAQHYPHPQYAPAPYPIQHAGYVPYPLPGTVLSAPMAPPQNGQQSQGPVVQVVHTDDAATKLNDRVRRRCFNCCTTDTSTWRRSNLSPGKVLCNKCGLFERTHSRPRPEQFPHKRGPLATSTPRSRSPPPGANTQQQQPAYYPPPPQHQQAPYIPPLNSTSASAPPAASQTGAPSTPSHPGTPNPQANGTGSASAQASPRLPGVDSWEPQASANGEKRRSASPQRGEDRERREERRDE